MPEGRKTIVWFNEVTKNDIPLVGGKGANLGEMTNANIPVPPGFVVTSGAYFDFLKQTKLTDKIRKLLASINVDDSQQLQAVCPDFYKASPNQSGTLQVQNLAPLFLLHKVMPVLPMVVLLYILHKPYTPLPLI